MTLLLILGIAVVAAVLLLAIARRRRFTNRGRGAVTGRWNRRI